MDCRVDPALFLRLGLGDAHVIRNAGGRVTEDVLRSLTISVGLLGVTAVAVIRHTGCGLQGRSWDVRERLGQAGVSATGLELHTFTDLEESVREDVVALRHSPALRDRVDVRGFVYRVADGVLAPVDTP
jgi:carbonic anhydrase